MSSGFDVPGLRAAAAAARAWLVRMRFGLLGLLLGPLLLLAVLGGAWWRCGVSGCPNVDRLRAYQPGKASRLLDRSGRVFAELRPVRGQTVPLRSLPAHVPDAFLAVEDRRFYEHGALDWRRVVGAALANVRHGAVEQGFSTVSMQLARNVFPDRIRGESRTLRRKLVEIRVAYAIEDNFAKAEILELYLSHIYFGNGARGVEAAARHYFGTSASRLSLSQAALLAALIRGPAVYDPRRHPDRARARRDFILTVMERQRRVSAESARRARAAPLRVAPRRPWTEDAPGTAAYFVEEVRRQVEDRFGERVYDETMTIATTLDARLQRAAEDELERQLRAIERGALGRLPPAPRNGGGNGSGEEHGSPDLQGAVVALEIGTGDVLAWVGGRDFGQSRFDRVRSARRQAGSAFKPFVYAAALQEKHHLSELLRDERMSVRLEDGRLWEPRNFDGEFEGRVTLRESLVRSKNVPTVRLGQAVGGGRIARVARDAGIRSDIDETPALPLGTVAVSPLEMTTAYGALGSLGETVPPRLVLHVRSEDGQRVWTAEPPQPRRVLSPAVAFLVTDVLREAVDRGTGASVRNAGLRGDAAGKTGTTSGATDTWFVGYTPRVAAAVWIGFDVPRPIMALATGSRLAAPVWARMMKRAEADPQRRWSVPEGIVELWVDPESGAPLREGCRPSEGFAQRELFLREALPRAVCPERGEPIPDEPFDAPSDEDAPRDYDLWPDDFPAGSQPPPPRDYEQAEWPRQRAEQWWRDHPEELERARRRRGWGIDDVFREEADRAWRTVQKEAARRLRDWLRSRQQRRRDPDRDDREDERRER